MVVSLLRNHKILQQKVEKVRQPKTAFIVHRKAQDGERRILRQEIK